MLSLNLPEVVLWQLLYADGLVLESETIETLMDNFRKLKQAFVRSSLKVSLEKTRMMVSGCITKDGLSKVWSTHVEVCCLRVRASLVLCA